MKAFSKMATRSAFKPGARLQSNAGIREYLGGISQNAYSAQVAKGILPGPVPGTKRYDVIAHDLYLDRVASKGKVGGGVEALAVPALTNPWDMEFSSGEG